MRKLMLVSMLAMLAVECSATVAGRWKLDDYPIGTVLQPGTVFKNKVNPGVHDAVICAVDPAQADEQYLPVVTNGFPAGMQWEPSLFTTNLALIETSGPAVWFRGGGKKGYYLKIDDSNGELKASNLTFELFGRSVNKTFSSTVMSMPAAQDGSWGTTNSFAYIGALNTWPNTSMLWPDATSPTGYKYANLGWNASAKGAYTTDDWYWLAIQVSEGTLSFKRDHMNMYQSHAWTHPDNSAPFIVGGDLFGSSLVGCVAEIRLLHETPDLAKCAFCTFNGAPHGTELYRLTFDEDSKVHGTPWDGYFNVEGTYNDKPLDMFVQNFMPTNAVQARCVHPGKARPAELVENIAAASAFENDFKYYFGKERSNILTDLDDFTLECFVRIDELFGLASDAAFAELVGLGHYDGDRNTYRWGLQCYQDGRPRAFFTAPQYWGNSIYGKTSIVDGKWHHLALTVKEDPDTGNVSFVFYVDHAKVASTTAQWYSKAHFAGRRFCVRRAQGFKGAIDEVRITKGVLDPETEMLWQRDHDGVLLIVR